MTAVALPSTSASRASDASSEPEVSSRPSPKRWSSSACVSSWASVTSSRNLLVVCAPVTIRRRFGVRVVIARDSLAEHGRRHIPQVDRRLEQPDQLEHLLVGVAPRRRVGAVGSSSPSRFACAGLTSTARGRRRKRRPRIRSTRAAIVATGAAGPPRRPAPAPCRRPRPPRHRREPAPSRSTSRTSATVKGVSISTECVGPRLAARFARGVR